MTMTNGPCSRRDVLMGFGAILATAVVPSRSKAASPIERRIPGTGETLPAVGLGTWQVFDVAGDAAAVAQARETLKVFVDLGGRGIDSPPMYGASQSLTRQGAAGPGAPPKPFLAAQGW